MKKKILVGLVLLAIVCAGAMSTSALVTKTHPYRNLVVSAAGAETDLIAATGFNVGIPDPGTDALAPKDLSRLFKVSSGVGETIANSVVLTCYATASDNNTAEMTLYGIVDNGAPEQIAGLVYIFGTAIRSTGVRWADTCTVTDVHPTSVDASDSGNNRIVKVAFDTTGYRHLYMIVHGTATGAATGITVQMRPF